MKSLMKSLFGVTRGRIKPPKQIPLWYAVKTLTNDVELVSILNRYGPGISYSQLEYASERQGPKPRTYVEVNCREALENTRRKNLLWVLVRLLSFLSRSQIGLQHIDCGIRRYRCIYSLSVIQVLNSVFNSFQCGTQTRVRYISITSIVQAIGQNLCSSLLGMHAYTGCDTVSAFSWTG